MATIVVLSRCNDKYNTCYMWYKAKLWSTARLRRYCCTICPKNFNHTTSGWLISLCNKTWTQLNDFDTFPRNAVFTPFQLSSHTKYKQYFYVGNIRHLDTFLLLLLHTIIGTCIPKFTISFNFFPLIGNLWQLVMLRTFQWFNFQLTKTTVAQFSNRIEISTNILIIIIPCSFIFWIHVSNHSAGRTATKNSFIWCAYQITR